MSDLAMCQHEDCPKAERCLRFKATPNPEQSYVEFQTILCNESNDFEWFFEMKIEKKEEQTTEENNGGFEDE